jgi:hypothetical protein
LPRLRKKIRPVSSRAANIVCALRVLSSRGVGDR